MSNKAFRRTVLSVIILAGILLYSSALNHPQFLYDGIIFLQNNPFFKDLDYYAQLFDINEFSTLDEQLGLNSDITTNFMMRPVAYLTFSINYMISGFNPAAYRAVNIAIHILNSLLVFLSIEKLLNYSQKQKNLSQFSARFIPTSAALLFLLHPMQTESVTYITQRFTSLAALFYLTTIFLYLVWSRQRQLGIKNNFARWLSLVVMLLGMLVRESLITAPIMILMLELTVLGNDLRNGLRRAAPHLMLLPVIPLMVVMVSAVQNNSSPSFSGAVNVVNYVGIPVSHYALTQLAVIVTYMRLYLLPYGQNVDHDFPMYTLPYQWPVVCSGMIILFLVFGAYILYRRNRDDVRCELIFVGVCWYFLGILVSSSFIPMPDLMAEHRSYFSSIGFIMALVCLLDFIRSSFGTARASKLTVIGTTAWCIILAILTYKRNDVWQSGIKLWSDSANKSPAKHRPWYNLGVAYIKSGKYSEALKYLNKSIELSPEWSQAYEVLAVSYLELKRYQDAMEVSLRGINADPANPVYYNNLGIAYAEMDREEEAKQAFSTAIALLPGYENARVNLDRIESFMESSVGRRR